MAKRTLNPLLGGSNFNLEESFGVQPTLIVPPSSTTTSAPNPSPLFNSTNDSSDPFSDVNLGSSPIKPPNAVAPPPVMSLGPPQPGLFLLPTTSTATPGIPTGPPPTVSLSASKPRSRYVPPPGIHSSASSGNLAVMEPSMTPAMPPGPPSMTMTPTPVTTETPSAFMSSSSSVPDFGVMRNPPPELYPGQHSTPAPQPEPSQMGTPEDPVYHWYFKVSEMERNVLNPT